MSEQMNTSAKRILTLIQRLDNVRGQADLFYQRYSQAFEVEDVDIVYRLLVRSRELVRQYIDDIKGLDDEDFFTAPINPLLKFFSLPQIHSSYGQIRGLISSEIITKLEFADRALSRKGMEKELPADFISEITESINALDKLILNSDLPLELKHVLSEYIVLFRKALTDYQIIGIQAFKDAFERSIGKYVVNKEALDKPEAKEADDKVKKVMGYFGEALSFTFKHWDKIKELSKFLLGDGSTN
jgi:hypothetical protein